MTGYALSYNMNTTTNQLENDMALRVRKGSLYLLRPVGLDATDRRVAPWKDSIVRVVQPYGCPANGTMGHTYVESRAGEFIGLVLLASLEPLDKRTKNAIRRGN